MKPYINPPEQEETPTNAKWEERVHKIVDEFFTFGKEKHTADLEKQILDLLLERERELEEHRYKLAEAIIEVMREFTVDLPVGHPHQHPMEESILRMYIVKILGQEKALSKAQSLLSRDYLVK